MLMFLALVLYLYAINFAIVNIVKMRKMRGED